MNDAPTPRIARLQVRLCAVDQPLHLEFAKVAEQFPDWVTATRGSILDDGADAVVSPANSFGFLDGGLDATYLAHFGDRVQYAARSAVLYRHDGELLVGAADAVATGSGEIPYLVLAPTMRVPMTLPADTVNPYLAMRAVLRLIEREILREGPYEGQPARHRLLRVAVPGLGTGTGRVSPRACARQVAAALRWACGPIGLPPSWLDARMEQRDLVADAGD